MEKIPVSIQLEDQPRDDGGSIGGGNGDDASGGLPYSGLLSGFPLSLTEIATGTGVSIATISRINRGNRIPSFRLALRIAQVLGISVEDLERTLKTSGRT